MSISPSCPYNVASDQQPKASLAWTSTTIATSRRDSISSIALPLSQTPTGETSIEVPVSRLTPRDALSLSPVSSVFQHTPRLEPVWIDIKIGVKGYEPPLNRPIVVMFKDYENYEKATFSKGEWSNGKKVIEWKYPHVDFQWQDVKDSLPENNTIVRLRYYEEDGTMEADTLYFTGLWENDNTVICWKHLNHVWQDAKKNQPEENKEVLVTYLGYEEPTIELPVRYLGKNDWLIVGNVPGIALKWRYSLQDSSTPFNPRMIPISPVIRSTQEISQPVIMKPLNLNAIIQVDETRPAKHELQEFQEIPEEVRSKPSIDPEEEPLKADLSKIPPKQPPRRQYSNEKSTNEAPKSEERKDCCVLM